MASPKLILASSSPRRIELLGRFGLLFDVRPSSAEELHDHSIPAAELCSGNALLKAGQVAALNPASVVLGADTLVTCNGVHFGKPRDLVEAAQMLERLSGRTHQVITGVALLHLEGNRRSVFSDETQVTFKALSAERISEYLSRVPVLDKAGAYAIQDHGELLVEKTCGSLTNVIGLPVERLAEELCAWGLITRPERDRIVAHR